ncbi:hypothetical protein [Streptomyces vinaceus]|uniref:hypothetical protein n=1 Tax=Streptomyces vinaceus TaxID=1960 RepID=UPI0037F45619
MAHAALGGSAAWGREVVPLREPWSREAGRTEERLRLAGSWQERFAVAGTELARRYEEGRRSTGRSPSSGGSS